MKCLPANKQDPVDGFVKQQVETAEKLVALVGGAFASIDKVARGAELLTPAVQLVADRLIQVNSNSNTPCVYFLLHDS